jgi:hypothetical protein
VLVAILTLVRVVYGRRIDLGPMDYKMLVVAIALSVVLTAFLGGFGLLGRGEYFCLVNSFSRRGLLAFGTIVGGTMLLLFLISSACYLIVFRFVRSSLANNFKQMSSRSESSASQSSALEAKPASKEPAKDSSAAVRVKAIEEAENRIITYLAVHIFRLIGEWFFLFFLLSFFLSFFFPPLFLRVHHLIPTCPWQIK